MDLKNFSRDELLVLQKDIETRLIELDQENRMAALAAAQKAASDLGFSLEDLVGGKSKAKKYTAPAKYRDPETGKYWSGRGRRPAWLAGVTDLSKYEI